MRIFYLEFIRQSLNIDQLHFIPTKKGHLFKLGIPTGPFIVNARKAFKEVKALLEEMKFGLWEIFHYDTHGVISQRREKIKASVYLHQFKLEVEWKFNIESRPLDT